MPVLFQNVSRTTPMGATLLAGGAVFRTWAPSARDVYVVTAASDTHQWLDWLPSATERLIPLGDGTWAGFVPSIRDGDAYLFWVRGPEGGSEGFKRDSYARELDVVPSFPNCPCLARPAHAYPWRTTTWRSPAFHDLIIYQLHVGAFWAVDAQGRDRRRSYGRFLDVVHRIEYLRDLGVTAIQLLPVQEYDRDYGLGYAGLDYFSPEMAYQIEDLADLGRHLAVINDMLPRHRQPLLLLSDIRSGPNQLKCLIDLCHLHGLAVIFDLVYNHAGGDFGHRSMWFYDRQPYGDDNRSLYFTDKGWAGGKVFAFWKDPVRQFLIDNALFCLDEYRIDGIRYDEVSVIKNHGGDRFCRDLTDTVRYAKPEAIQIAEYWNWDRALPVTKTSENGLGFDAAVEDQLRIALRATVAASSGGAGARLDFDRVRDCLYPRPGFADKWRAVQHVENHDLVLWDVWDRRPRDVRIPRLADPSNARSWFGRSRSRVVTTLLLTAPGIPMLFMGQEFLEDKPWCDDVENWPEFLIWWDGLTQDRHMRDFRQFTQDLLWLRRSQPALRGEGLAVPQVHNADRVIVVHRWVEGQGRDVVVVGTLNEGTFTNYPVDFPWPGRWNEVFNSDHYDHFPNAWVAGNGGGVVAEPPGHYAYPYSARLTLPANGALVFARQ